MPQLQEAYIDTGKVYFLYRDFPLTQAHPAALLAAHVSRCAAAQEAFWPMHDRLFQGQDVGEWRSGGQADFQTFLGYAADLGLDTGELQTCVESNQFASQIERDLNEGVAYGVRGTPTFLVNGELFVGAQPFAAWQSKLDALLAEQE